MTKEFKQECIQRWETGLKTAFKSPIPRSAVWTERSDIIKLLNNFTGGGTNHLMLPHGGGQDVERVLKGREHGCLEFQIGEEPGSAYYTCKPKTLYFEHFPEAPENSFLLLDSHTRHPTGIDNISPRTMCEDLLQTPGGIFHNIECWDIGYLDEDEEQPIPKGSRYISRFLRGKFLLVCKHSLWNRASETYDGRHNKMESADIRYIIEQTLLRAHHVPESFENFRVTLPPPEPGLIEKRPPPFSVSSSRSISSN